MNFSTISINYTQWNLLKVQLYYGVDKNILCGLLKRFEFLKPT